MGVKRACVCCIFPEKSAIKQCPLYFTNYNKTQSTSAKWTGIFAKFLPEEILSFSGYS